MNKIRPIQVIQEMVAADQYFSGTKFESIVRKAQNEWVGGGKIEEVHAILTKLPSDSDLLGQLMEKIKDKRIYKTIQKMNEGEVNWKTLKAVSSLLTHTAISCEKGELEFRRLIPKLQEKINEVSYKLLSKEN